MTNLNSNYMCPFLLLKTTKKFADWDDFVKDKPNLSDTTRLTEEDLFYNLDNQKENLEYRGIALDDTLDLKRRINLLNEIKTN